MVVKVALIEAVKLKNYTEIKALIDEGKCMDYLDMHGRTPLSLAIEYHNHLVVDLLLERGANVNMKAVYGNYPLDVAILHNNESAFIKLLNKGAKLKEDEEERFPLFHRTVYSSFEPGVDYLLQRGVDINKMDEEGNTPLVYAVRNLNKKIT